MVEKDRFAIYFRDSKNRVYRTIVARDGTVIVRRQATNRPRTADDAWAKGDELRWTLGTSRYFFPRWERLHNGKPFYTLKRPGHAPAKVSLPWGDLKVDLVHDAVVVDRDVVLLVTPDLHLFRFSAAVPAGPEVASTRLGVAARIYDFPRASNIVPFRQAYVVCWLDARGRLLLTLWNPRSGTAKTTLMVAKANWNTRISIGVIDDTLLIAYHNPGATGASQIKVIVKKLPL